MSAHRQDRVGQRQIRAFGAASLPGQAMVSGGPGQPLGRAFTPWVRSPGRWTVDRMPTGLMTPGRKEVEERPAEVPAPQLFRKAEAGQDKTGDTAVGVPDVVAGHESEFAEFAVNYMVTSMKAPSGGFRSWPT